MQQVKSAVLGNEPWTHQNLLLTHASRLLQSSEVQTWFWATTTHRELVLRCPSVWQVMWFCTIVCKSNIISWINIWVVPLLEEGLDFVGFANLKEMKIFSLLLIQIHFDCFNIFLAEKYKIMASSYTTRATANTTGWVCFHMTQIVRIFLPQPLWNIRRIWHTRYLWCTHASICYTEIKRYQIILCPSSIHVANL